MTQEQVAAAHAALAIMHRVACQRSALDVIAEFHDDLADQLEREAKQIREMSPESFASQFGAPPTKDAIHSPDNEAPVNELYAWLSIDEAGREGICASTIMPLGTTPLVTARRRIADKMEPMAQHVARGSGKPVRLIRFERAETVREAAP